MTRPLVRFAKPYFGDQKKLSKKMIELTPEEASVLEVLRAAKKWDSKPLTNAGWVQQFEEAFSNLTGGIAVAVSSCDAALRLCLMAKGIKPGDIIVLPALTHVALPNAIEVLGAKCKFIDSHIDSGNLDPDKLEVPYGTQLISVTHFLGHPAYMGSTTDIARHYGLEILEDCALALGSVHSGRHVGCIGMAGCFSFYPCKHITTAEGGMVVTHNPDIAEKIKKLRSFGYGGDRDAGVSQPSGNYRMTEMQGALGLEQLKRLQDITKRRDSNLRVLKECLKDFQVIGGNYGLSVFVGPKRDEIKREMWSRRVESSVYYPLPLHKHPYYKAKYGEQSFPVAEKICAETITLSVGPHLNAELMAVQAKILKECIDDSLSASARKRRPTVERAA